MKILAVETSSQSASAALCEDDALLGEFYVRIRQTHSETLMPCVSDLLGRARMGIADIGLFAVTSGPGSFTGVRIGVAAVKGMAVARAVPCAAVSSLEAAAWGLPFFDGIVCAVMDARRGQFYNALFECRDHVLDRLTPDRAIDLEELGIELKKLQKKTVLVGDGSELCYNRLKNEGDVLLAPERIRYPHAAAVAALGLREYLAGRAMPPAQLQPMYLRLPQAERELRKRMPAQKPEDRE